MTGLLRCRREEKNGKDLLGNGSKLEMENYVVFGKYSDAELIAQLKLLALDPCNSEFSPTKIGPLWNQTLRVRKAMALTDNEFPRRKRKLQQFVRDKLKALPGSASGFSSQQNRTMLRRGPISHASSASCLFNSVESAESFDKKILLESHSLNSLLTSEDNSPDKQMSLESSFMGDDIKWSSSSKDISPLVDSDESVICSNPLSPENWAPQEVPSLNLDEIFHNSVLQEKPSQIHLQPPRRSIRLLNFIGDHPQRMVVPVGARFQADVPEWTGPCKAEYCDSENLRWLGTRIWPVKVGDKKNTAGVVGKGRPESCCCSSPSSIECSNRHILEERLLLQCDLGPAFFIWKFDEMGEQVSKSWTLEEQQSFDSFSRMKTGKDFLKHTLKCFPYKSRKSVTNYYFNVFIPRRMSHKARISSEEVDSDEDETDNCNYLDLQKGTTLVIGCTNDVKRGYLRGPFLGAGMEV